MSIRKKIDTLERKLKSATDEEKKKIEQRLDILREKINSKISPGQWSNINTKLKITAKLKKTNSFIPGWPSYLGKYITHDDGCGSGGYRAKIKITMDNFFSIMKENDIDDVLAACEKSLNCYVYKNGKKVLGDIVIIELLHDEKSKREGYLPCLVKTNRRHIPQFMGVKKGNLQVF